MASLEIKIDLNTDAIGLALPHAVVARAAFGNPLTSWDIYKIIDEEPGVSTVSQVRMLVDEVPDQNVKALCADSFQPHTWYAGADDKVFRSTNDTDGWESVGHFPGEKDCSG